MKWPDLVFSTENENADYNDVSFITLKEHYREQIIEASFNVINQIADENATTYLKRVEEVSNRLIDGGNLEVKSFVNIDEDLNVTICTDVDRITDDNILTSLNLLTEVTVEPNTFVEFGNARTFTKLQLEGYLH